MTRSAACSIYIKVDISFRSHNPERLLERPIEVQLAFGLENLALIPGEIPSFENLSHVPNFYQFSLTSVQSLNGCHVDSKLQFCEGNFNNHLCNIFRCNFHCE